MKRVVFFFIAVTLSSTEAQAQKKAKAAAAARPKLEQGLTATDGKRVGKWNFYNSKEELELTFDYDSSRIKFLQPDTTRYLVRLGEQWLPKIPARTPHFLGSTDQHLLDLQSKLRYPIRALRQQLQGTVLLSYTVDATGHTRDYTVEQSLSSDCDKEVWQALKELPDNWIPAVYMGRPTPARFYLAVQFRMMDEATHDRLARDEKRRAEQAATGAPNVPPLPSRPHYTHEVFVTAMSVERGSRTEHMGR